MSMGHFASEFSPTTFETGLKEASHEEMMEFNTQP